MTTPVSRRRSRPDDASAFSEARLGTAWSGTEGWGARSKKPSEGSRSRLRWTLWDFNRLCLEADLARLGHPDRKGMPNPLQLALSAREFSDIIVFRSPPRAVQHAMFGALAPIARWRGYRATYPQLSRIVVAHRM